ncbi:MAG: PadR family transcriptional regulator [Candidatus Omnitrophica bacterium]|nr:PadR family transcriptional regulator [Candidatus Omnitrophota bacterium]
MKENEFILLGLLKESPKHPYQIKKEIKGIISTFLGLELKSIYYPLRLMKKKGLVDRVIERQRKRPFRYVYKITPKGEEYFFRLLNESFLNFKRPQFSLDLCLYFLSYLDPSLAKRRLKARIFLLKRLLKGLQKVMLSLKGNKNSFLKSAILRHNAEMLEVEIGFLARLVKNLS